MRHCHSTRVHCRWLSLTVIPEGFKLTVSPWASAPLRLASPHRLERLGELGVALAWTRAEALVATRDHLAATKGLDRAATSARARSRRGRGRRAHASDARQSGGRSARVCAGRSASRGRRRRRAGCRAGRRCAPPPSAPSQHESRRVGPHRPPNSRPLMGILSRNAGPCRAIRVSCSPVEIAFRYSRMVTAR